MDSCPTCDREDFKSEQGIRQHHARTHGETLEGKKAELTCENCGVVFEVENYLRDQTQYCSKPCVQADRERPQTITCECDWCGDTFERYKSKSERRNGDFCDHDCYGAWRADTVVGENHPQWRGGNRDYGKGWNEKKRRLVRERDDKRCVACGMTQEQHKATLGAVLAVHHIRPARLFDDPETRNAMQNLITLCRHCHHKWEGIPLRPQAGV